QGRRPSRIFGQRLTREAQQVTRKCWQRGPTPAQLPPVALTACSRCRLFLAECGIHAAAFRHSDARINLASGAKSPSSRHLPHDNPNAASSGKSAIYSAVPARASRCARGQLSLAEPAGGWAFVTPCCLPGGPARESWPRAQRPARAGTAE